MGSANGGVSRTDIDHLSMVRRHVTKLWQDAARAATSVAECSILEVAPQDHGGIRPLITAPASVTTFDIDPTSGADVIGDICEVNSSFADGAFDMVICTEVLEHVGNPFAAVTEILRLLKPGGRAYLSAPFNFRIHGPLPDNWRFTEHGWRQLLTAFESVEIFELPDPDRFLMPVHYNVVAVK